MKNDYSDQTYRLEKYFDQLKNVQFDISANAGKRGVGNFMLTISGLSEKTEIPIEIVRTDAVDMLLMTEDKFFAIYDSSIGKNVERNDISYAKISKGQLDEGIVILNSASLTGDSIALTSEEFKALEAVDDELSMQFTNDCPFFVKDYAGIDFKGYDFEDKLEIIEEAIKTIRHISFVYRNEDNTTELVDIIPIEIRYDKHISILTCTMGIPKIYEINRIKSDIIAKEIDSRKPDSVFLSLLPQVWGYDFVSSPYFVKVKFYNDPGVFSKVKSDLKDRTMGSLTEDNNALYYEDTVYGIDAFKKWVYSFGNSAVVIKPVKLRQETVALLKSL